MVDRRNDVRRQLNRLAHQLRRADGEIGTDEIPASGDRRFSVGDRVIARIPDRHLHPPGRPDGLRPQRRHSAPSPPSTTEPAPTTTRSPSTSTASAPSTVPRTFFDEHDVDRQGAAEVGIDHAYAVTRYAVQGATHAVSTSRIDATATRAETYVDITRGQDANHLYLTRPSDHLDGEHLPRTPPDPVEDTITRRLAASEGERTAWEIREDTRERVAERQGTAIGL